MDTMQLIWMRQRASRERARRARWGLSAPTTRMLPTNLGLMPSVDFQPPEPPLSLLLPRVQTAPLTQQQTAAPNPSDLERLIGGVFQLAGVFAVAYAKYVLIPQLKAEVDAELKEAARDERIGDFVALLLLKYGLHKASDN